MPARSGTTTRRSKTRPTGEAVCARCKRRRPQAGYSRCVTCRRDERAYWRRLRAERRRSGACPECGRRAARNRKYCAAHLAYHAQAARAYRRAQKARDGRRR